MKSKKLRGVEAYYRVLSFSNSLHTSDSDSVDAADNKESIGLEKTMVLFIYYLFFCKPITSAITGKSNGLIVSHDIYRLEIGHRWSIKVVIFETSH